MAATMAMTQSGGLFQNIIEQVARRIDTASNHRFGNWLKDSTGLSPLPGFLSKPNFGVTKALQSTRRAPSLGDMLIETVNLSIEEAKDRLSALVGGSFIPTSVYGLFDYLKEHSFSLETRINKATGEFVNYLVDATTKQRVPAAQVDPSLSHRNVLKLDLQSRLRQQIGNDNAASAYGSWSGMSWMRENTDSKFGYTVENGQGYFGRVVGVVSASEQDNFNLVEKAKASGIALIVPREQGLNGKPIVGMPILARSKSMKAEEVARDLDYARLTEKFGIDMVKHYQGMAARANSPSAQAAKAPQVSHEEFNKLFLAQERDIEPAAQPAFGFGDTVADRDVVIKTLVSGRMLAWDRDANEEVLCAVNCLPYGEYERYDDRNKLEGFTTVGDRGHVTHYDRNHKIVPSELPTVERDMADEKTPDYRFGV
jgi:hypothetical protein